MKEFSDNVFDTFADYGPNKTIQRGFYTCLEEVLLVSSKVGVCLIVVSLDSIAVERSVSA